MEPRGERLPRPPLALVLDADSRAGTESIQSLGRHQVIVDAAAEGAALGFSSRQVRRRLSQPAARQESHFCEWLRELDRDAGYSLIIPSTERSLRQFLYLSESDQLRQKAVLPSNESLRTGLDKSLTLEVAASLGIPAPDTVVIRPGAVIPSCVAYPVVLKPVVSLLNRAGELKALQARLVRSEWERQSALEEMLADSSVLQQEYVEGRGVGVEMLYCRGKGVWYFAHERLHEGSALCGLGGGSSYRRAISPNQELLRHTRAILDKLDWHGVAMVEYKVAIDGRCWLMEVNPRLWGSLALAIDAGLDFPYGLLCVASGRSLPRQPDYCVGYRTRSLFDDFEWLKNRLLERPDARTVAEVWGLLRPLGGGESWDHFDWHDLGVTAAAFRRFMGRVAQAGRGRVVRSTLTGSVRRAHKANLRRFRDGERPRKVLLLCYGNICRSPSAELLMRRRYPGLEILSAGFHPTAGRGSPPHVREAARAHSIDLSSSASRRVTRDMVRSADAVFLADLRNYRDFCREFPEERAKVLMLGLFLKPAVLEIEDPYDLDLGRTNEVLGQISAAIDSAGRELGWMQV